MAQPTEQDLAHAQLGPSSAHRWMNCPGSVILEADYPNTTSEYAAEGTVAHEIAEILVRGNSFGFKPGTVKNVDGFDIEITSEMLNYVEEFADYVSSHDQNTTHIFAEQRVDLSHWIPEGFGTADAVTFGGGLLSIIDLKYGAGVKVDVENNPQLMCYALGALKQYDYVFDVDRVKMVVHQPRLDHVSEWEIPVSELLEWGEETLKPAAIRAYRGTDMFSPSEKTCQWCKAKATCPALKKLAFDTAIVEFDSLETNSTKNLTNAEISEILPATGLIKKWCDAVEAHAFKELSDGREIEGYKLVAGRSIRKWGSEEEAEKALVEVLKPEEVHTRKLISPTQAEKLLGKSDKDCIQNLIVKPEGKPTVVPVSDKREAINTSIEEDFKNIA